MYKIDISWYYCGSNDGRLRLSRTTRQIKICGTAIASLDRSPVETLTFVDTPDILTERRRSPRLVASCDAEVLADLSILDTESIGQPSQPLVFMGQTKDLSRLGVSIILPSLLIDERFCTEGNRLELSLFLPGSAVTMVVSPVRCAALDKNDGSRGYLLGARIDDVLDHRDEFERYLLSLAAV